jgi:hypothetical protein
MLSELDYFSRRLGEEIGRLRRGNSSFRMVLFTSQPPDGEPPEVACVRGLPAVLTGVRDTDCVARIGTDTIAVILVDTDGEGSRKAALRLLEQIGDGAARWNIRVLDYPAIEPVLAELGLVA